nr:DAK2 domain-containing protein [Clostridium sp.]
FRGIGATDVISGGQTMNPSTDDILRACENANADVVYVFPNNSNIILAANQARDICESCRIVVVPTKTVPQGVEAIINFVPEMSPEENLGIMTDEIAGVKTCEITYAVRDTTIDGKPINHGDIMAIGDNGLVAVGREIEDTALMALRELIDEDSELVTIYYGEEAEKEKAESLCELAKKEFDGCEFELHNGGQPVYYYVLSVE